MTNDVILEVLGLQELSFEEIVAKYKLDIGVADETPRQLTKPVDWSSSKCSGIHWGPHLAQAMMGPLRGPSADMTSALRGRTGFERQWPNATGKQ